MKKPVLFLLAPVALLVLFFALVGVLYVTRGTPVTSVRAFGDPAGPPAVEDPLFVRTVQLLAGMELVPGNEIELLANGDETYPRIFADLRSARSSITLQLYYCNPGRLATQLKDVLLERAKAGVRVLFLHDAVGSAGLPEEYFDSLSSAGIRVAVFRPIKWYSVDKLSHRSHIRVVVVDGAVGYTGGFGLDDKWLGNGLNGGWRETNVRFLGPAVAQLQATFAAGWAEATGELLTGDVFFPHHEFVTPDGSRVATAFHAAPTVGSTPAERFLAASLAGARRTLYITAAYFVPDDDFRRMLTAAVKRGVDVRVLTAGEKIDVPMTRYAGRAKFEELLEAGVRIFEYGPSMVHAKTFVVDGIWTSVGTMNFDNRSLAFNDETNLVAYDATLGAKMNAMFLADLAHSREVTLEAFRRRPWTQRAKEWMAVTASRVL